MAAQTVPDELLGCWQRRWIEFADGTRDDTSLVVWLQLPSAMADVRLSADAVLLAGRGGFDALSIDELVLLADGDSSAGTTSCTPLAVADGTRRATARWHSTVSVQPVSAFPEPGLLAWSGDGTVLVERAPSGAYVEEWQLLPGSRGISELRRLADGSQWYRAGEVGVLVHDDRTTPPTAARLTSLAADRPALEAALCCEFSFARLTDGVFLIEASTLPWRVGAPIPC